MALNHTLKIDAWPWCSRAIKEIVAVDLQQEDPPLLYTLHLTATSTSLSSLPLQSVKTGGGQIRRTWPQMAASSTASFAMTPSSTFASASASASAPNLSGGRSNSSERTDTLPALPPRKFQFAGDIHEDWLFADSVLNFDATTVTLAHSLIAAELDSLPSSAPQTPTAEKRQIPFAGSDNDVLAVHRATQSAPGSAKAAHITFLPLPASHNSAGAAKLPTRSASPAPAARSRPLSSAKPLPTSLPSTASDPDLEQADLLLTRHMRITSLSRRRTASQSFACRLQHFRQQIQTRRFQKLSSRTSSSAPAVHAHNTRAVKSWVSEQRGIGARTEEGWMMADL